MNTHASTRLKRRTILAASAAWALPVRAEGFDHSHAAWSVLLKKHVVPIQGGKSSKVRHAGVAFLDYDWKLNDAS
jgi:hypothetical protein